MAEKVLEMKGITKRFPGVLALDNVTFEAYAGEILALCGENGAGKSTLMKVLSGSFPATDYDGEIWINGEKQNFMGPGDAERAGIAMIYQEISMHLDFSVAENLFLGHLPLKHGLVDWKAMNENSVQYLARVGLEDLDPTTHLRQMNASQQQLVSIARALSKNPKILVLDEPTSPLTLRESNKLFEIIHRLKDEGIACILITHKMDEVFTHSDRVVVLRDGKSVSSYMRTEVDEHRIVADMVGREITSFYPKEQVPIGEVVMEVKDITVRHPYIPGRNIVEDVSFNVRKGEILGLAGLVGAGRSETVNAIFGSLAKASGQVFLDGKEITINKPADAIANGIALVTEDRKANGIMANRAIKENITMVYLSDFAKGGFLNLKKEQDAAQEIFDRLNVKAPSLATYVGSLSGGNQQKIVLSKWLLKAPKVLILDEPTRGIDVGAKFEIYKIMTDLVKQGVSIIMISSELPELLAMSDRILVVASGAVQAEMPASEATQEKIMEIATTAAQAS